MTTDAAPWLDDWVHGEPLPAPAAWGRPGLGVAFNLECAGCVSRALPWLKRLAPAVGDRATLFAVHTAYAHKRWERDAVVPRLVQYATRFADLPFPVALDLDGAWAEAMGAEGTPHWWVWDAAGRVERSLYGSQENALTRLGYVVEGWGVASPG